MLLIFNSEEEIGSQQHGINTIVARGFNTKTTEETLTSFFENSRRSGDDEITKIDVDRESNVLWATFANPGVAERVISMPRPILEGATLTVQKATDVCKRERYTYHPTQTVAEAPVNENTPLINSSNITDAEKSSVRLLEIRGFLPGTPKWRVETFLKKATGEKELESCDYDADAGTTVVAFKNSQAATKLMSFDRRKLNGVKLSVAPIEMDRESSHSRTVVSGIVRGTSREHLSRVFENQRRSGGGDTEDLEYNREKGKAIITFKDANSEFKDANSTALGGFSHEVEPNYCHPRSIEVSGIGRGTTVEHLRLLFENQRRHGGGEIDEVEYDDEESTAIITFTDAHVASRVVRKESVVLRGSTLHMRLMIPPTSPPIVEGPLEEDMFLLSGLSPKCTAEDVKRFFSTDDVSEIQRVIIR
ncbi:hypothetical protein LSAT2_007768 [Lamellibrachia satsuma]|nr:hypothetical protein LSAT2_007768 [Lamellibrachia satsuma]